MSRKKTKYPVGGSVYGDTGWWSVVLVLHRLVLLGIRWYRVSKELGCLYSVYIGGKSGDLVRWHWSMTHRQQNIVPLSLSKFNLSHARRRIWGFFIRALRDLRYVAMSLAKKMRPMAWYLFPFMSFDGFRFVQGKFLNICFRGRSNYQSTNCLTHLFIAMCSWCKWESCSKWPCQYDCCCHNFWEGMPVL